MPSRVAVALLAAKWHLDLLTSQAEDDALFLLACARNLLFGAVKALVDRIRRGRALHPKWSVAWEVRTLAVQQIVLHGQDYLWHYRERGYRTVNRLMGYLGFLPYRALQLSKSMQTITVQGRRPVSVDVWTHKPMPVSRLRGIIVYLHGGGIAAGNRASSSVFCVQLLNALPFDVGIACVEYVLSPELPHPAPLEDCVASLEHFVENEGLACILAGDSGGGNLVASMLVLLQNTPIMKSHVKGAFLISPMLDNTHDKQFSEELAKYDIIQPRLAQGCSRQLCECPIQSKSDPVISPVLAKSLHGLPPLLIHCGSAEIFLDDCQTFAATARQSGVDVEFTVFEGLCHCFQCIAPDLPETTQSMQAFGNFCKRVLPLQPA